MIRTVTTLAEATERRAALLNLCLSDLARKLGCTPAWVTMLTRRSWIWDWQFERLCRALETTPHNFARYYRFRGGTKGHALKWAQNCWAAENMCGASKDATLGSKSTQGAIERERKNGGQVSGGRVAARGGGRGE